MSLIRLGPLASTSVNSEAGSCLPVGVAFRLRVRGTQYCASHEITNSRTHMSRDCIGIVSPALPMISLVAGPSQGFSGGFSIRG